jgi:hypothetical protein
MRLNHLQITTHLSAGRRHRACRSTAAVAERNSHSPWLVGDKNLRRAAWRGAYFYFCKDLGMTRHTEPDGQSAFRSPASQPPVGAAFSKAQARQEGGLTCAEPIIVRRHIRFDLFLPMDLHQATLAILDASATGTSRFRDSNSSSLAMPRSTASIR